MTTGSHPYRSSTLLDEFSQTLRNFMGADNPQRLASPGDEWRPPVDIRQNAERYLLEVELPGIDRDAINVELDDGELTVRCERTERDFDDNVIRRERHLGGFVRHFRLPEDAQQQDVSARVDSGVLLIRVPRKGSAKIRSIDVG